jgi:hypothetical protein
MKTGGVTGRATGVGKGTKTGAVTGRATGVGATDPDVDDAEEHPSNPQVFLQNE